MAFHEVRFPDSISRGARGGPEEIAAMKQRLGLDLPLWRQYLLFLGDILSGSLGRSVVYGQSVTKLVLERLPATLWLVAYSTMIAVVLTIPLALWSAVRRDRTRLEQGGHHGLVCRRRRAFLRRAHRVPDGQAGVPKQGEEPRQRGHVSSRAR